MKEHYVQKLNRVIIFFKSMNFLKYTTVKNLLLFASRCQESRIPSKTVLTRQHEDSKYLFFVKSGRVKILKDLEFRVLE